jgi:hypothetical protein
LTNNQTFTGNNTFEGADNVKFTVMPGLSVNFSKAGNIYNASGSVSLAYSNSASPAEGDSTFLEIVASALSTITFPSTYSLTTNGTLAPIILQSGETRLLRIRYLNARWEITGDPYLVTGTGPLAAQTNPQFVTPFLNDATALSVVMNSNIAAVATPPSGMRLQLASADAITTSAVIDGTAAVARVYLRRSQGIATARTAVGSGVVVSSWSSDAYGTSAFLGTPNTEIQAVTTEAQTNTNHGNKLVFRTTPNGSSTIADRVTIEADGTLTVIGNANVANLGLNATTLAFASPAIDFLGDAFKTVTLTGNITFTTTNKANGKSVTIRIIGDSSSRTLTFPAWVFVCATPTALAANKVAILTLTAFGTADTDIVAAYAVQP